MFDNNNEQQNIDKVEQFSKQLFGNLVNAAKLSNNLPSEEDYSYYETFPEFKLKMNSIGKRLLSLTQNFVHSENPKTELTLTDTNDVDDLSDRFNGIVDIVDGMIDKVDKTIDPKYNQNQTNIFISSTLQPGINKKPANEINMFYGNNIARPQLKFEDPVDNNNFSFLPKIRSKPNSMIEFDPIFQKSIPKEISFGKIIRTKEQENIVFPHPYEYEINNFKYTTHQTQACKEILSRGLDETPYTWVCELRQLEELCEKLSHIQEFAIDLEHHSYRTYQGFVCLMQISTRTEDFVIDTLALRPHIQMLNSVFTNPSIVKVLHGSDSDIKWLQRDFGVYIVNMFDTGQASRVLEYPSASLAFLLKFYCAVDAQKKYQLADWRIRKIPDEMIKYAREDTHYLLYIYDRLRNELINKSKLSNGANNYLLEVLRRSRELSMIRYEKEILDESSHLQFAKKANLQYNPVQLNVLKVLYHWRENLARDEDESVRYVLPNQMMFSIVERQPTSVQDLLSLCSPIPPSVKIHAHQLIQDILRARVEDSSSTATGSFMPQLHTLLGNQSNMYYTQKQQQQQQAAQLQAAAATAAIQQAQILQQQMIQQQNIIQQQQQQLQALQQQQIIQQQQRLQQHANQQYHINGNQQQQQQGNNQSLKSSNDRSLSPIPNIKSNHNSNSPVLTTDQLYKTAKWLSSDIDMSGGCGQNNSNNLQPTFQSLVSIGKKSTSISTVNQSNHSTTPISNNSLFDISNVDLEDNPDRKRSKRIASMVALSFEPSSFAPVFKPNSQLKSIDKQQRQQDSDMDRDDDGNDDGNNNNNRRRSVDDQDNMDDDQDDKSSKSSKSGNGGTSGDDDDDDSNDDDEDDDEDDDDDESDDESDENNKNSKSNTPISTSSESNTTPITTTTTTTTTASTNSTTTTTTLNNNQVPKSMQEIYQLSNMNRRRNKEKKKLKETSTSSTATSPSLLDTASTPKSKKDENVSVTDTFSFLKEIGWINNEQSADSFKPVSSQPQPTQSPQLNISQPPQQQPITNKNQQQAQQQQSTSSGSGAVSSKKQSKQAQQSNSNTPTNTTPQFVSFDYSQVSSIQQTTSSNPNQQQNFFNTDFHGTKKKSSSTGSVKAKSGTFNINNSYKKK